MSLHIAGQDMKAGDHVILCTHDGKLYTPPCRAGSYVGEAVETIREGLRCSIANREVREDDA